MNVFKHPENNQVKILSINKSDFEATKLHGNLKFKINEAFNPEAQRFDFRWAENVQEAINLLEVSEPDLVIYEMEVDGIVSEELLFKNYFNRVQTDCLYVLILNSESENIKHLQRYKRCEYAVRPTTEAVIMDLVFKQLEVAANRVINRWHKLDLKIIDKIKDAAKE